MFFWGQGGKPQQCIYPPVPNGNQLHTPREIKLNGEDCCQLFAFLKEKMVCCGSRNSILAQKQAQVEGWIPVSPSVCWCTRQKWSVKVVYIEVKGECLLAVLPHCQVLKRLRRKRESGGSGSACRTTDTERLQESGHTVFTETWVERQPMYTWLITEAHLTPYKKTKLRCNLSNKYWASH